MTDVDLFERDLEASLRSYASEAPTVEDPKAFALAIALEHPLRSGWMHRPSSRTIAWIFVGAAVILAVIALGVLGVGRQPSDLVVVPRNPMPDELFGVRTAGTYSLDVNDSFLLREPGGQPVEWAGAAGAFVPAGDEASGAGDLVIRAAGPCGDGRYTIQTDIAPVGEVPAPSASGGNPTPAPGVTPLDLVGEGQPFVLVPVNDSCADRLAILASGPWDIKRIELIAGRGYDSMSFTEPFDFLMPVADPTVPLPGERSSTKGVLRIGNGYSWSSSFHDDVPVFADVCDTQSPILDDIPATPEDVGAWLRSSTGLTVGDPVQVPVDGRIALSFAIEPSDRCVSFDPPLGGTQFNLGFRVYAIPTDDDTILYVVWSDAGSLAPIAIAADELVRSMRFR